MRFRARLVSCVWEADYESRTRVAARLKARRMRRIPERRRFDRIYARASRRPMRRRLDNF